MTNAPEDGRSFSFVGIARTARHLSVVRRLDPAAHEHTWALRETEHDGYGLTLNRFECDCGGVSYI